MVAATSVRRRNPAITAAVLIVAIAATSPLTAADDVDSRVAFDRLKGLVGTWNVGEKGSAGAQQIATYVMASRNTAIVEQLLSPSGQIGMMTVYNLDGDRVMMTHYCGAGNHPRMRVKAVLDKGRRIQFEMFDITNHASPQAYHSTKLDVVFVSDDRVDLEYRGMTAGSESTQVFQLTRKKSTP